MRHVSQMPHAEACQQACYAMLADVTIGDVIAVVGHDRRMAVEDRERAARHFGIKIDVWKSIPVAGFGVSPMQSLAALMKEHGTLLCSVNDYRDIAYGHAVVVHAGSLYDPYAGIDPAWPWSRVITHATPVS